jgi:hypothetical protein
MGEYLSRNGRVRLVMPSIVEKYSETIEKKASVRKIIPQV